MKDDNKFTNQKFKLVGTRVMRPDGVDKVTGRARYGADAFAPGQLVGEVLRSPHAHAKIRGIDTRRAEKLKGVIWDVQPVVVVGRRRRPCPSQQTRGEAARRDVRREPHRRFPALPDSGGRFRQWRS